MGLCVPTIYIIHVCEERANSERPRWNTCTYDGWVVVLVRGCSSVAMSWVGQRSEEGIHPVNFSLNCSSAYIYYIYCLSARMNNKYYFDIRYFELRFSGRHIPIYLIQNEELGKRKIFDYIFWQKRNVLNTAIMVIFI